MNIACVNATCYNVFDGLTTYPTTAMKTDSLYGLGFGQKNEYVLVYIGKYIDRKVLVVCVRKA